MYAYLLVGLVSRGRCSGMRGWMQRGGHSLREAKRRGGGWVVEGGAAWHCLSDLGSTRMHASFKLETIRANGNWKCSHHRFLLPVANEARGPQLFTHTRAQPQSAPLRWSLLAYIARGWTANLALLPRVCCSFCWTEEGQGASDDKVTDR